MAAPQLPGFDYVSTLGSGGFADVHAYDQRLPKRRVAIKVLRDAAASGSAAAAFLAEANALASLSHPHIVAVHSVGLAADGRPYLVMPLYPGDNLGRRARVAPLPLDEVLMIGVQLAGAVETAHRHGLLHRDIKPANVLVDAYGSPALADFGLASSTEVGADDDYGVSVPWSPPETLFGSAPASVQSDVYSLAATLWTLLAGHAPFDDPSDTSSSAVLRRIRTLPVPPTGRADVPPALEALLADAMAKRPGDRPVDAVTFAEGLRGVQRSLGIRPTEIVVGESQRTLVRADGPAPALASVLLGRPEASLADTVVRAARPEPDARATQPSHPARPVRRPVLIGACLVAAVLIGLALWSLLRPQHTGVQVTSTRVGDRVTFTWTYPGQTSVDRFEVTVANRVVRVGVPSLEVDAAGRVCASVQVLGGDGTPRAGYTGQGCAP